MGKQFWKVLLNYADLAVSLVSAVEVISTLLVMPVSSVLSCFGEWECAVASCCGLQENTFTDVDQ